MLRLMKVLESITLRLEHFPFRLILPVSLPGLTGQSSTHGRCLLDRPVKPGDDSTVGCQPNRKCSRRARTCKAEANYLNITTRQAAVG